MNETHSIFFRKAFVQGRWAENTLVSVKNHRIVKVETGLENKPESIDREESIGLPGLVNVHSHAFQRAFSGLSEFRTADNDSFWTWRNLMYEFLKKVTPEMAYEIAVKLYREMKVAGYSAVGEFHYLHHRVDGTPYNKVTKMADAVISAAKDAEIAICILPVLYQHGGFDDRPLAGGQLRFGSSNELYLQMLMELKKDWGDDPHVQIGIALHSLRAVSIENARQVLQKAESIIPDCPIHVHIAEQVPEVEECLSATGKRPVELLLDSFEIDQRWCLVHATHLNDQELSRMAESGAIAGICPTTEANLGDGIFRGKDYLSKNGRFAVGSDSHISVSMSSELRLLEYSQRLLHRKRAILCNEETSCGNYLYDQASSGGALVTGFGSGRLAVGDRADFLCLNPKNEFLQKHLPDRWLDYFVFSELPSHDLFKVISV